jgi:hypothetical protein
VMQILHPITNITATASPGRRSTERFVGCSPGAVTAARAAGWQSLGDAAARVIAKVRQP